MAGERGLLHAEGVAGLAVRKIRWRAALIESGLSRDQRVTAPSMNAASLKILDELVSMIS